MKETEFAIRRFDNRNGVISWRVDGLLGGVRIRKNFKTREEAIAGKAGLELKNAQLVAGMRPLLTTLAEAQLREAEAAFARLTGKARSLTTYLDFALVHFREPEEEKKLADAIAAYVQSKEHVRPNWPDGEFRRRDARCRAMSNSWWHRVGRQGSSGACQLVGTSAPAPSANEDREKEPLGRPGRL